MIDYHNHTKLCKHAEGELFEYVESAIARGITELAFTDHMPLPDNFDIAHRMAEKEMEIYAEWVTRAQSKYPEIKILFGIEADYYEGFEEYTDQFLKTWEFDLVIMSIHFLQSWPSGNWVFNYNFPNRSYTDIYQEYLYTIIKGIKTGLYDIVGHLDIIKMPGYSLIQLVPQEVKKVLTEIKNQNMVLEFNSSGFRKKVGESYPAFDMFDLIKQNDISICVGSDSHAPDQVAFQFDSIYEKLNQNGFKHLTLFDSRKQKEKPIQEKIFEKI